MNIFDHGQHHNPSPLDDFLQSLGLEPQPFDHTNNINHSQTQPEHHLHQTPDYHQNHNDWSNPTQPPTPDLNPWVDSNHHQPDHHLHNWSHSPDYATNLHHQHWNSLETNTNQFHQTPDYHQNHFVCGGTSTS